MITRTVKVSEELIHEIDEHINAEEYSTRADFVLHALRETVSFYAETKRIAIKENDGNLLPESEMAEIFRAKTDTFLEWNRTHNNSLIQINTRVPEGLEKKIDLLIKPEYGFKKKSDFTRVAIEHLLMVLREIDGVFRNEELFAKRQKAITEIFNKEMPEGLSKGIPVDQILKTIQDKIERLDHFNGNQD